MRLVLIPRTTRSEEGLLLIEKGDFPLRLRAIRSALKNKGCGISVVIGPRLIEKSAPFIDFGWGPKVYLDDAVLKTAIREANRWSPLKKK